MSLSPEAFDLPRVTSGEANYATLTINGRIVPCSDLTVRTTQYFLATNPTKPLTPDEVFEHVVIRALATAGIVRYRPPRWLRLWQRRHEKAAARRTKMRAARYAARWEQAHLRDKPAPVDRAERIRGAVGELEALVDAWESSK